MVPSPLQVHQLNEDVVDALVGEGGRAIDALRLRTGAAISIKPDGEVQVYAADAAGMAAAMMGVRAAEGTDLERNITYKWVG